MKNHTFILSFVLILLLFSCNSSKKSDEVASYTYEEEIVEMSDELKAKMPDWLEEGKICYGLVVQFDKNKKPVRGKTVKAKIVQIGKNAVKMKALEAVNLVEVNECSKLGIARGQIWEEKDGDFYLTREEAINALKKLKLYNDSDKATVD